MAKNFEEIWTEATEKTDVKYNEKGTLSWVVFLKEELKSRIEPIIQQQALPVVPECVAEFIEQSKGNLSLYGALYGIVKETDTELHKWASEKGNRDIFARAWLDGYTVEKPQLFYLKNKLTGLWLMRDEVDKA